MEDKCTHVQPFDQASWQLVPKDDDRREFSDSALPAAMISAGAGVLEKASEDLRNYVAGETIDWDYGMEAVAVYRAMLSASPSPVTEEESEPCAVCGNEERGQGGYLSCECPAPSPVDSRDALIERLVKALSAFAEAADIFEREYGDKMKPDTGCNIKFSALCEARAVLASKEQQS